MELVRVFWNKVVFVSRAFFHVPCTRRQEDNEDGADHYKMQKDDNNSPLDMELKLLGKHIFAWSNIFKQDKFITSIRFVLALVDSFKVK